MGSQLSNTFKISYGILFTLSFIYVFSNIDIERMFDFTKLIQLLDYILFIMTVILGVIAAGIFNTVYVIIKSIGTRRVTIPVLNITLFTFHISNPALVVNYKQTVENILYAMYPRSTELFTGDIVQIITDFIQIWAIAAAFILLPIIILAGLGFIMRGENRLAITSFVAMQILIIVAMYTPDPAAGTGKHMMKLDLSLPVFKGTVSSLGSDFVHLLQTPIFQLGLLLYLLLEVAFQASYAISVVDPMIEREKRIKKHLQRIDNFQPQPEKDKKQNVGAMKSATKGYDILAASYLREMVDRKIFKRGQQLDQKTTMRLQSFISNLRRVDRQFEYKITAKSAQPDLRALLFNAIPSIIIRVVVVVLLSFLIINPTPLVDIFIANPLNKSSTLTGILNFPQLADSIELTQPEFRTVIVFNLVLFILFISALGHWLLVHKPETEQVQVQKIETLVDFQEIDTTPIIDEGPESP